MHRPSPGILTLLRQASGISSKHAVGYCGSAAPAWPSRRAARNRNRKPKTTNCTPQAGRVRLGAEFMVHSFSGQGQTYIVKDFLVVEVALYPGEGRPVHADPAAFTLRVNGNKRSLPAMPATAVVASIERPEWRGGPRMEGGAGIGGVILGIPGTGGPASPGSRPSAALAAARARPRTGLPAIDAPEQVSPNELLVRTAFPAGRFQGPVSGFIYFPYRGKMSSIKSLDLLYQDARPEAPVTGAP